MRDRDALALEVLLRGCAALPAWLRRGLAWLVAGIAWRLGTRSAAVTLRNLELCFPAMPEAQRHALARRSLAHAAGLACELGAVWSGDWARLRRRILRIEGLELVRAAAAARRGLLVLAPHLGNWEVLIQYLAELGPATVLYREPRRPALAAAALAGRTRRGTRLVPATQRGVATLLRALRAGEIACVLPDQQPRGGGVFADFFGVPALTPTLAHGLLRRTGCGCVMAWCDSSAGGFVIRFEPMDARFGDADPQRAARVLNAAIERAVGAAPEQYQWEYRRFAQRPPGAGRVYASTRGR